MAVLMLNGRRYGMRNLLPRQFFFWCLLWFFANSTSDSQFIAITRSPKDDTEQVNLRNLLTNDKLDPSDGKSFFLAPTGPYLVEFHSKDGALLYSSFEFIDERDNNTATIIYPRSGIMLGATYGLGGTRTECESLEIATKMLLYRFGVTANVIESRLGLLEGSSIQACRESMSKGFIDHLATTFENLNKDSVAISIQESRVKMDYNDHLGGSDYLREGIIRVLSHAGKAVIQCGQSASDAPMFCDANRFTTRSPGVLLNDPSDKRFRLSDDESFSLYTIKAIRNTSSNELAEAQARALSQKLTARLSQLLPQVEHKIASLKSFEIEKGSAGMGFISIASTYYKTSDVVAIVQNTNQQVDRLLSAYSLDGLRAYYLRKAELIKISDKNVIAVSVADEAFSNLLNLLKQLKATSNDLSVIVSFSTIPSDSTKGSKLAAQISHDDLPVLFSQNGSHRFYRGMYEYVVTRKGFKTYSGRLDLVEDPSTNVVCHLVVDGDHQNESYCTQE